MTPTWAQRQEELLRDCIVFPDVFTSMVDRLGDFVVPYQQALETEAGQRNMPLYLAGLLSHLARKNAEQIAASPSRRRGHERSTAAKPAPGRGGGGKKPATSSVWRCSTRGVIRCPTAG